MGTLGGTGSWTTSLIALKPAVGPFRPTAGRQTSWTDYRVAFPVTGDGKPVGAVVRHADAKNHYLVRMTTTEISLIRRKSGREEVLWKVAEGYAPDRSHMLCVDVVGTRIAVYLNGRLLRTHTDGTHRTGSPGLFCDAGSRAEFSDFRVAAPVWSSFYQFPREPGRWAATLVDVHTGSEADRPRTAPNVENRYRTATGQIATPVLGQGDVLLRLRLPNGDIGHAHRFFEDRAHRSIPCRVARTGDGTKLVLLPEKPDQTFQDASYRLKLTYFRKLEDPAQPVVRQNGDQGPEEVVLDFPV